MRPLAGLDFGPMTVTGLRIAGAAVDIEVATDGQVRISGLRSHLRAAPATVPAPSPPADDSVMLEPDRGR